MVWIDKKVFRGYNRGEMTIKPLYVILLVAGVALLAVGATLLITQQSSEQTPASQPDIQRYTADQVIAIAQAQYPTCFKRERIGEDAGGMFLYRTVDTPSSISVTYIGGSRGAWKVKISCPFGYRLGDYAYVSKTLYFYESDGTLRKTYYP